MQDITKRCDYCNFIANIIGFISKLYPCEWGNVYFLSTYVLKVIDHYENPRNVGSMDKGSKDVGTGLVGAPACGDVMKLQIKVDDKGEIVDAKFKTFGCGSAIASSSLATEWIKGKTVSSESYYSGYSSNKWLAVINCVIVPFLKNSLCVLIWASFDIVTCNIFM